MIMIAGDFAVLARVDSPVLPAEHVPNAEAAAVFVRSAFDLIRRGSGTPHKPGRKGHSFSNAHWLNH